LFSFFANTFAREQTGFGASKAGAESAKLFLATVLFASHFFDSAILSAFAHLRMSVRAQR
jgi:hypothetical protein